MKPKMDSCYTCEGLYDCYFNNFDGCVKIEMAANGLGIPFRPKKPKQYLKKVPFGVYMHLKKMLAIINKGGR